MCRVSLAALPFLLDPTIFMKHFSVAFCFCFSFLFVYEHGPATLQTLKTHYKFLLDNFHWSLTDLLFGSLFVESQTQPKKLF